MGWKGGFGNWGLQGLRFRWNLHRVSFSRPHWCCLWTLNDAPMFTKLTVAEFGGEPKALDHPQAGSLGLPLRLFWAWIAVHRLSEVKSKDNVLVIGKICHFLARFICLQFGRCQKWNRLQHHSTAQGQRCGEHLRRLSQHPPQSNLRPQAHRLA